MSIVWSLTAAATAFLVYRNHRMSGIFGLLVFSHWVLDFIVHPRELNPLLSGSPRVGLGLWCSGAGFIIFGILEFSLLVEGIAIYLTARRRKPTQVSG